MAPASPAVTALDDMAQSRPGAALDEAAAAIGADTIAKILFTSGSTGLPKGVINTHGMLTANQQQLAQIWPFLDEAPLVLLDWLPWNHTFGANHNFNLVLRHAGTLFIDGGRPVPALIAETARNLGEISPTIYFNVPAGYAALLPFLERDEALARSFFAKLRLIFYAGAALPQDLWERLEAVALRTTGERVPMTSSWGTTETSPLSTAAHFLIERAGPIGVPVPGVELKLVPAGGKLEVRVRGPNVTPGYWKRPDLTRAAFDAEGFYQPGRCGVLRRSGETGTRHSCLPVAWRRISSSPPEPGWRWARFASACSPLPRRRCRTPSLPARTGTRSACWPGSTPPAAASSSAARLRSRSLPDTPACASTSPPRSPDGISTIPARHCGSHGCCCCRTTPSIDANEITDKGYINQRLALERRKADVERLFAAAPDADVIVAAAVLTQGRHDGRAGAERIHPPPEKCHALAPAPTSSAGSR
jgi:feruloyl-CoA synthase